MAPPQLTADPSRELAQRIHDDPVVYANTCLGIRCWSRQAEFLRAVAEHTYTALRSGHKVSKSTSDAILALWWAQTRWRGIVVMTATAGHQLGDILWPEVCRVYDNAPVPLGGKLSRDYHRGLRFSGGRRIFGKKVEDTSPESFAGISSPNLLYLIDEASGFPDTLYEAARGNLAGGGKLVATSNPTRIGGWYYDAFHGSAAGWATLHIDSRESPNITGREPPVPGLATAQWEEDMARDFGRGSPAYSVRVEGNFATAGDCTVNSLATVDAARARGRERASSAAESDGELRLGVDVGRTGDDPSVVCVVRGNAAFRFDTMQGQEGDVVAGWVLSIVREERRSEEERPETRIDLIGVGASVYDHLKHSPEVKAVGVNVAENANDPKRYARKRDELWFAGRDFLKDGGSIPPDDGELHGELTAARYGFDPRGRFVVESKDELKKRLKRSPNKADALNLAVSSDPVAQFEEGTAEDFADVLPRSD
jgi:hypothetical protein